MVRMNTSDRPGANSRELLFGPRARSPGAQRTDVSVSFQRQPATRCFPMRAGCRSALRQSRHGCRTPPTGGIEPHGAFFSIEEDPRGDTGWSHGERRTGERRPERRLPSAVCLMAPWQSAAYIARPLSNVCGGWRRR